MNRKRYNYWVTVLAIIVAIVIIIWALSDYYLNR